MKRSLSLLAAALIAQGCANDPPKEYPPAPVTPEYPAKLSWANLNTPMGVDKYTWLVPAVNENAVFVAERTGVVSQLSISTGKVDWQIETGLRLSAGPTLDSKTLYLGSSKAEVIALDSNGGKSLWVQSLTSEVLTPPQVSKDRVIVRTNDGKVFGLRRKDGKVLWSYDRNVPALTLRGNSTPIVVDDSVIVGFDNGLVISLSLLDGKTNWETTISVPRGRTELERMVDIDGPLFEKNGVIYVSSYGGKTVALSAKDGSIQWTRDIPSFLGANGDETHVYVTDANGRVWALDRDNGATLWMQESLKGRLNTRPLRYKNSLVVGDAMGELYWLSIEDGRILGHMPHDKPSKLSGATYYIDEIESPGYFEPRREETSVIFEPRTVEDKLIVTYQNGILASIVPVN